MITDENELVKKLNENCRARELKNYMWWTIENLSKPHPCYGEGYRNLCMSCNTLLGENLMKQIEFFRDPHFQQCCDECKEKYVSYVYDNKPRVTRDEEVREKILKYDNYCDNCRSNFKFNAMKKKLKEPNANINEVFSDYLNIFQEFQNKMSKQMDEIKESIKNKI